VWVTGERAAWPTLREALTARGITEVQRYDAPAIIRPAGAGEAATSGRFVTAIGLGLQGLGLGRFGLNLMHEAQAVRRARGVQRLAGALAAVGLTASLALGASAMLELRQRRHQRLVSLQRQEQLYQTLRPQLRELLQDQQHLERRIQRLEQLVAQGGAVTHLLAQTAERLPDDVWLTKLEFARAARAAAPAEGVGGLQEGRAKSFQTLTQFTDRLKGLVAGADVKPLSTNVAADPHTGKDVVTFAVQFHQP
jgi:Tfp pilus assembly protein PilN